MTRIVVAGAGAIGASVAYHLALLGARDVVLVDRAEVGGGATAKAMGGVRQQFSTAAEVRLTQESIRFFEELGAHYFHQVGYLFLAMTEPGLARLEERHGIQSELGVPVQSVSPREAAELAPGVRVDDVRGASFCATDGVADPTAVTRELVRRVVEDGVQLRERTRAENVPADVYVIACGARSAEVGQALGVELPVRPLCRQLLETAPLEALPERLPMTIEEETGFHFRRRGDRLVLAMPDPAPRWGFDELVDESLFEDRLRRLGHRFPAAASVTIERGWAGLYDMTPDAHPILGRVGDGLFAACGFSGHGFMQAPAAGRAVAEEILTGTASIDLSPYRLDRFAGRDAIVSEELVL